jgi:hypothetical protein
MKKIYIIVLLFLITGVSQGQQNFLGNGKSGFGAAVGASSLTISHDATSYYFSFTKGAGAFNDALIIYVDSKTGGFSSTAGFNDNADGLRTATSGFSNGSNKSVLTFPTGFLPDYAISFDQGFAAIFELVNGVGNSLIYIGSGNITPTGNPNAANYSISVLRSQLAIGADASFNFLASYISTTAYRADEFIGEAGPIGNPGYSDYTATTFNTYVGNLTPLLFIDFAAKKGINNSVQISWSTEQEINLSHFEILRSTDAAVFSIISSVPVTTNNNTVKKYSFTDINPINGNNYYKIFAIDKDGKKSGTQIIKINIVNTKTEIVAFKNISEKIMHLKVSDLDKGFYSLVIINDRGQQIHTGTLVHNGNNTIYTINISNSLVPGIYRLILSNNSVRLNSSFISL